MTRVRFARLTVVAALLAVAALVPAAPAAATNGSSWWYDRYGVADAQAAGWTGEGVRIAVIDAQIDPALPVFQGADLTVHEPSVCGGPAATTTAGEHSAHGSDVTSLLIGTGAGTGSVHGIAPKAHVTFYGDADTSGGIDCTSTVDGVVSTQFGTAIRRAVADGNRIISISQTSSRYEPGDVAAIAEAVAKGVVIVAGEENDLGRTAAVFPHGAEGVVSTNAFGPDGALQTGSDGQPVVWPDVTVVAAGVGFPSQAQSDPWRWGDGDQTVGGTSLATPLVAGMLALTLQKYPTATGDQLIQSLIRNTTADDHALHREDTGYGYGPASLTHLLRVDPTRYPDENPLLGKDGGLGVPTASDIARAGATTASPGSTGSGGHPAEGRPAVAVPSLVPVLVVVGVVALLIVVALVIVLVALGRGRRPVAEGPR